MEVRDFEDSKSLSADSSATYNENGASTSFKKDIFLSDLNSSLN
jgi:hypothetical protein